MCCSLLATILRMPAGCVNDRLPSQALLVQCDAVDPESWADSAGRFPASRSYTLGMTVADQAQPDTLALVERARRGDAGAFEALVTSARRTLETYVRIRIGEHLRHRLDVEDVLQESFVQAWKSMASFRWTGDRCFERWLARIAEHVILKAARRRGDQKDESRRTAGATGSPPAETSQHRGETKPL